MAKGDRNLRLYWLAIGVPAVLFALGGLRLLHVEARRARESEIETLKLHSRYCAERCTAGVQSFVEDMLFRIADLGTTGERQAEVARISATNACVKKFYSWRERFEPGPPHMRSWEARFRGGPSGKSAYAVRGFRRVKISGGPEPRKWRRGRPAVKPEAQRQPDSADGEGAAAARKPDEQGQLETMVGEWVVDGKSRLMGVMRTSSGDVCTIEIDPALLFEEHPEFSGADGGVEFAVLRDGSTGAPGELYGETALAPVLSGWKVRAFRKDAGRGALPPLLLAGGCLLALLVFSLFAGAALLVRDARRQRREALMKTDFVSNVSHELKTPLTAITLWAELAAGGKIEDAEKRKRAAATILAESKRLGRLVDNLLDFGRLESKRRKYNLRPVSLREAASAAIGEPGPVRGAPPPALAPGEDATALADRDAVVQILSNLLSNAAKYAPGAGAEVTVRRRPGGPAEISVRDSGPGVPEALREKIFERFFRADDGITATTPGCGIGLSLARALARGMGGDIAVRSAEGGGAEFVLTLPAADAGEGDAGRG